MCDCLYVCLKKLCLIYSPVSSRYKGVQNMQATLHRSGSAWYRQLV